MPLVCFVGLCIYLPDVYWEVLSVQLVCTGGLGTHLVCVRGTGVQLYVLRGWVCGGETGCVLVCIWYVVGELSVHLHVLAHTWGAGCVPGMYWGAGHAQSQPMKGTNALQ
jgi:hypothetical protein